jgi:membrane protease subunit HflC
VVWIDKRVRDVDMERQQVLSTDQRRLEVDGVRALPDRRSAANAHRGTNEDKVEAALKPILGLGHCATN